LQKGRNAGTPSSVGMGSFEMFYYNGFHNAGEGASMLSGMYDLDKIEK
jgi:hypothetical protein